MEIVIMEEQSNISATKTDVAEIKNLLSQMNSNFNQRQDNLDRRMDKFEQRMDKLEQRMDKLELRMDKLEKNLETVAIQVAANFQKIEILETKQDADKKHEKMMKRFNDVLGNIKTIRLEKAVSDHKIDQHEKKLDDHEERLLEVEHTLG
jgi:chromosome segregation ATPase